MKISSHAMRLILLASVLVSATALLLLFSSQPAQADGVVYVSNMDVSDGQSIRVTSTSYAQAFKTGGTSAENLDLGSIELNVSVAPEDVDGVKVRLFSATAASAPNAEICTLTNPTDLDTTGVKRFAAVADCSTLDGGTTYFVSMDYTSTGVGHSLQYADSGNEDSGAVSGWGINDKYWLKISGSNWINSGPLNDVIKIRVREPNTPPTASDGTVHTPEGTAYAFKAGDFRFDSNGDPDTLGHVAITSLPGPGEGTLWLEANSDDNINDGEAVAVNDEVTKGDIDGGKLRYTPPATGTGQAFTSFKFKVNDGLNESVGEFIMSIDVHVVFVSNTGQVTDTNESVSTTDYVRAQAFTTGSNPKGYDLGSVELYLRDFLRKDVPTTVKLYSSNASGQPDEEKCTLVTPDITVIDPNTGEDGIFTFAAPASCPTMGKATEYFMVVDTNISPLQPQIPVYWEVTDSPSEDADPSAGWSISDKRHENDSGWGVGANNQAFQMQVNGAAIPNALPTSTNATVTTNEDTTFIFGVANFTFSDTDPGDTLAQVKITPLPDAGTLWLDADDNGAMVDGEEVSVDDSVVAADLVKLKYTPPANAHSEGGTNSVLLPFTTFGFKVNDGYEDSASGYTMTVKVTAVNDAPVLTSGPMTASLAENTDVDANPLATYTATDVDGDTIMWSLGETESGRDDSNEFSIGDGRLYFASPRDFEDPKDSNPKDNVYEFQVKPYDGIILGDGRDVAVTVTNVNEPPVAVDDTAETDEDTSVDIDAVANDTDVDANTTLTVTDVGTANSGSASITGNGTTITYTPNTGFLGIDTFTYTVSDDGDPVMTDTGTVTVKVRPAVSGGGAHNYAENSTDPVATYTANGSPTWSLSGADSGDFTISNAADDTNGELSFVSPPDFENPSGIVYNATVEATVGTGDDAVTGTLPVTVTVTDVNEPPTITSGPATVMYAENDTAEIATYAATDPEGDAFDFTLVNSQMGDAYRMIIIASTGQLTFKIPPDFEDPKDTGEDNVYEITVRALADGCNQMGGICNSGTLDVNVTVTDVNEAPVAKDDAVTTDEDTAAVISVLGNDTDEDANTTLSVSAVGTSDGVNTPTETNPANGTVVITAGSTTTITYTPSPDSTVDDTFTYIVSDGADPALTAIGTVTVAVTAVNDAPVAVNDYAFTDEVEAVDVDVVGNDTDVEMDTLSVTGVSTPNNGMATIKLGSTTEVTYTPDADFAGFDTFTYTVADGSGDDALTDTSTVTVSVAPTVSGSTAISYAENSTDPVETYTASGSPTYRLTGTDRDAFSIGSTTGVLTFNSPPDYESPTDEDGGNDYQITVVATVQSGGSIVTVTKSVTVSVADVTDPPTVTGSTQVNYAEKGAGAVATYNAGGSPTWSLSGADSAKFSISATGELTFDSTAFPSGPDYESPADADGRNDYEVTVQATESGELSTLAVTVRVTDLPVVSGPAVSEYAENGTDTVTTYSATDANGNAVTVTWNLLGADSAKFSISAAGKLTFDSTAFPSGPDYESPADAYGRNDYEVTVQATESGELSTLDVTVTVLNLADVPTAVDDTVTTAEGTAVTMPVADLLANDRVAEEGSALSVSNVGSAGNGSVEPNTSASVITSVTYTPTADFNGDDRFTYTISDGINTATGTVTVTVNPENDAPEAMDDKVVTVEGTAIVIDVVANDTDVDGDALSVSEVVGDAREGVAVLTGGSSTEITYTPGTSGSVNFDYRVTDGTAIDIGRVYVEVQSVAVENLVDLSALTVSPGTGDGTVNLIKDFAEETTEYTVNVQNDVASLDVHPTKKFDTSDNAISENVVVKIWVNGAEVDSGSSIPVRAGGVTTIEIEVIATISPDEGVVAQVSQTYTIRVTRPARPTSSNANLAALTVSDGALDVDFDSGITDYSMTVANSVDSISLDLRAAHDGATVVVTANGVEVPADNIPLTEGGITVVTVVVTAQDGTTTRTYTITVTRAPSANADLAGLTVSEGSFDTDFEPGTTSYSVAVANSVSSLSVFPKAANANATVSVKANGVDAPADNIPLTEGGTTVVTLGVTAQDGTTTTIYTIRVTRAPSANADLAGLTISEGSLDSDFEPGITSYSMTVANSVSSVSVFPRAANANATVTVKVNGVEAPADNIPLTEGGTTVITLLVTAQDGTTTRTYTIRVTRVPSSLSANSDLVGLTISVGSLDSDFEPGTTSYSVAVANSVSSVSVFPRAANADATVSVKVNGMEAPADNIPLTEGGTTVINVVVTAQDGSTSKTYTITVFRAARVSVGRRGGGGGSRMSRILIPSFVEGSQTIRSVAENTPGGANIGAPIVATDPTDDRLTYSLLGGDAAQFGIDAASGRLLTNGPLDFEAKSGYRVSVSVNNSRGGRDTIAVTINLTNVDEPGTVAVLPAQPAVGRAMTAVLTDPDGGVTGITWQWAVSSDQVVWLDIPGATSDTYSPVADDGGKYLRATAFYTDGEGTGKSAQATWDTPLVPPAAPETTLTPTPAAVAPSPEPTRAASPTTVASSAATTPTTPSAVPSAAVVPTPAPAAGVPATSALEQAADDSGIDLWVILLIAAVVVAAAAGLIILGVRIIRA